MAAGEIRNQTYEEGGEIRNHIYDLSCPPSPPIPLGEIRNHLPSLPCALSSDDADEDLGLENLYSDEVLYTSFPIQESPPIDDKLINCVILDPGSNTHVINSEKWVGWERSYPNTKGTCIGAGTGKVLVDCWGTIEIAAKAPDGSLCMLKLSHVAFVKGFLTSVIGLARCRSNNIHFDSGRDVLYKGDPSNVLVVLEYDGGHWLVDADPSRRPTITELTLQAFHVSYKLSFAPKPPLVVDNRLAHQIWGHPSKKAIQELPNHVDGIKLDDSILYDCSCDTCLQSRLTKMISRRHSKGHATRPFYRIGVDLIYIAPRGHTCWNRDRYGLHAVCEFSKWHGLTTAIEVR